MHQPLIFTGPGIPAGQRRDAFCYLLDIFPTLGALTGVAAPPGNEGQSLLPVITGEAGKLRDTIFTAYRHIHRAVRDDRWKLITYTQINKTQLFDLQSDPAETHDLATNKSEVTRLTGLLKDWQQKLGDTQPLTSDKPQPVEFDFTKVKVGKRPQSGME
jgi:arylsulfatase A-like enzyme